jgi:hypothetical protein
VLGVGGGGGGMCGGCGRGNGYMTTSAMWEWVNCYDSRGVK